MIKDCLILILTSILILLCFTPKHECKDKHDYLVEVIKNQRAYNGQICFSRTEVRGQDEYCWAYNVLDVVLHDIGPL